MTVSRTLMQRPRAITTLGAALGMLCMASACGKKNGSNADSVAAAANAPAAAAVDTSARAITVADVAVGHHVGADKKVTDESGDFASKDSVYASVHTTGSGTATVAARWTFQDGQVVDERSQSISPTGDAYTEFHIAKPSGWPKGKYTLHVLLNGTEATTKDFTVK
jgi:hypothetical protein